MYRFSKPTYRFSPAPAWLWVVFHALGLVGLNVLSIVAILSQQPAVWVYAVLSVLWVFFSWLDLYMIANELHLEDGVVRWRAPLRSGELSVQSIRSIRSVFRWWWLLSYPWPLVRIGGPGGPSVITRGTSELRPFVLALLSERPGIEVGQRSYRSWHHRWWPF